MLSSTISETAASASEAPKQGLHTAIIMDGNGRWAASRGLPRIAGHRAGEDAPVVEREADRFSDVGTDFVIGHGVCARQHD